MKKVYLLLLGLVLSVLLAGAAQAGIKVVVDENTIVFDVPPVVEGDRVLVPMRQVFEALGADVAWLPGSQTVIAEKAGRRIELKVGDTVALVDGSPRKLEVPARLTGGRTLAPLRFVGEALGCTVGWDDETQTVSITRSKANDKVVKIGLLAPLTGDVAVFGQSVKNGYEMALQECNYQAGDYRIETVSADDRNDAVEGINAASGLILEDGVDCIVGSVTSKIAIPASRLAEDSRVVLITPTATNEKVTLEGKRKQYVFRACFADSFQGTAAAKFALDNLKKKKAAVLYDRGNEYTVLLAENFKNSYTAGGGTVTDYVGYAVDNMNFSEVLEGIAENKPDIIYLPDYYMRSGLIARQARQLGITSVFLGGDGWDSRDLDFAAMDGSYFTNHYSPDNPDPVLQKFVEGYRERYGSTPDAIAALGYDAAKLLVYAIKTANSNDRDAIRRALQNTKDLDTVCGKVTFDGEGNPVKPAVIIQVKDGRQQYYTTINP